MPPDWEDEIIQRGRKTEAKRRRSLMAFNVDIGMRIALVAAAETRGMSMSAYARRAIAAFVAKDLGLPFESITKFCPSVEDPENLTTKQAKARAVAHGKIYRGAAVEITHDDGLGYGSWVVCDE